jgi:hypothetical protein
MSQNTTNNTNFSPGKNGNLSGGKHINFPEAFFQNDKLLSHFVKKASGKLICFPPLKLPFFPGAKLVFFVVKVVSVDVGAG